MDLNALFSPANMTAAGGIVVSLFSIYIFAKVIEKLMGNHVNHNTAAIEKLAAASSEQAKHQSANNEIMRRFADVLERKLP